MQTLLHGLEDPVAFIRNKALSQWLTPSWVAEELFQGDFSNLPTGSRICEPTCGAGSFLGVIPSIYDAFGCEIDPVLARKATANTGRPVIVGDFCTVDLPDGPIDAFVGNPPFKAAVIDRILKRIHPLLREGGKAGFILPEYLFKRSDRILEYAKHFSIRHEALPGCDLFSARLNYDLCWVLFTKESAPKLFGLRLFNEASAVKQLPAGHRRILINSVTRGSPWKLVVETALRSLGGVAVLKDIYEAVSAIKVSENVFWKEKVRQVLQLHFVRIRPGVYSLPFPCLIETN